MSLVTERNEEVMRNFQFPIGAIPIYQILGNDPELMWTEDAGRGKARCALMTFWSCVLKFKHPTGMGFVRGSPRTLFAEGSTQTPEGTTSNSGETWALSST